MTDPWSRLLDAQQRALRSDSRLDSLALTEVRKAAERAKIDVAGSILSARLNLTIDGASTVTFEIRDSGWALDRSGLLEDDDDGHLRPVRIVLDGLAYRLVQATRRTPVTLELVFEDEVVALLRAKTRPRTASRGSVTRAQFIEHLVGGVKAIDVPFYSPEKGDRQPTARPGLPDARSAQGETGFDDGATFKIKGQRADAGQMREVATTLTVADRHGAKGRARLAMLVAGIGESEFRAVMNRAGSPYGGVFQGNVRAGVFELRDTAGQARYFLLGGKGFQADGAIKAARDNPDWSPGRIALAVEGSGSNFPSTSAGEHHYQQHIGEARAIDAKWSSGDATEDDTEVLTTRAYQFRVGRVNGEREDWWEGMQRLAEQVRWRLFVAGGAVVFSSDPWLESLPATHTFEGPYATGLIEPPTYDRDNGKRVQECGLRVSANRYAVVPGSRVTMSEMGPLDGRWLVAEVDQDLQDPTAAEIRLVRALKPKKEPAAEIITRSTGGGASDGGDLAGAERAVKWARSKLGHYKEEFGNNRGAELDRLQALEPFSMRTAPWCAIFATTAVSYGGVTKSCRTALVATIRAWAEAGTHGYQRGLRANPRPGDLVLYRTGDSAGNANDHVGMVEKVAGRRITSIEGNVGSDGVERLTSLLTSEMVFVRPDYPN